MAARSYGLGTRKDMLPGTNASESASHLSSASHRGRNDRKASEYR